MGHPVILSAWFHQKPQKRGIPILPVGPFYWLIDHVFGWIWWTRKPYMTSPHRHRVTVTGPDGHIASSPRSCQCSLRPLNVWCAMKQICSWMFTELQSDGITWDDNSENACPDDVVWQWISGYHLQMRIISCDYCPEAGCLTISGRINCWPLLNDRRISSWACFHRFSIIRCVWKPGIPPVRDIVYGEHEKCSPLGLGRFSVNVVHCCSPDMLGRYMPLPSVWVQGELQSIGFLTLHRNSAPIMRWTWWRRTWQAAWKTALKLIWGRRNCKNRSKSSDQLKEV